MARVNEVVREAIGDELERLSDPRLGLVTVTGAIDHVGAAVGRVMAHEGRIRDEQAVVVLLFVLVAYVGGAALGASAPGEWRWAMALASGVVAVVALFWLLAPRRVLGEAEAQE
jgi:uncharacterized membrane protein YoaK (UPF0700 family)